MEISWRRWRAAVAVYAIACTVAPATQAILFEQYRLLPFYAAFSTVPVLFVVGPVSIIAAAWFFPELRFAIGACLVHMLAYGIVAERYVAGGASAIACELVAAVLITCGSVGLFVSYVRRFRRVTRDDGARCTECGYIRIGWSSTRCPECGSVQEPRQTRMPNTDNRKRESETSARSSATSSRTSRTTSET